MKIIEGTVWYRERMLPPPDTQIAVMLEDVSRMDVASDVIASTRFNPQGGPPCDFKLPYEPEKIDPKRHYALRVRIEDSGGHLLFINTDRIPVFENGSEEPVEIMVSRVGGDRKNPGAQASTASPPLTDTYWKLIKIGEQPALPGARQKELHVNLTAKERRVQGFSGCNQFSGSFTLSGKQLEFGPMMSTNMWCNEVMDQEQRYLKALRQTAQFSINGDRLQLFNDQKQLLLSFEAVYQQ